MKLAFITTTLIFLLCACTVKTSGLPNGIAAKPYLFHCKNKGVIKVHYAKGGTEATIDISLPELKVDKKALHFYQAIAASGARYINKSDNNISYEWHTKADYGHISMLSGTNKKFSISCQLQ
jgi:membrane-bound inhibitor of C-type lysozyme